MKIAFTTLFVGYGKNSLRERLFPLALSARRFNIPILFSEFGPGEWKGYCEHKIIRYLHFVRELKSKGYTHVVFTDARDVIYTTTPEEIEMIYRKMNRGEKVIFNADLPGFFNYPWISTKFKQSFSTIFENPHYSLNSGIYFGPVDSVLFLLEQCEKYVRHFKARRFSGIGLMDHCLDVAIRRNSVDDVLQKHDQLFFQIAALCNPTLACLDIEKKLFACISGTSRHSSLAVRNSDESTDSSEAIGTASIIHCPGPGRSGILLNKLYESRFHFI